MWTLKVFTEKLLNGPIPSCKLSTYCRGHDDGVHKEGAVPTQFRVYLPGGQISSNRFDPTKPIRDVLDRLKDTRADELKDSSFVPTDLKGVELPPSMTEQEIAGAEVCYGTDILDWYVEDQSSFFSSILTLIRVMIKENEQKQQMLGTVSVSKTQRKPVTNPERLRFVELLLLKLNDYVTESVSEVSQVSRSNGTPLDEEKPKDEKYVALLHINLVYCLYLFHLVYKSGTTLLTGI